MPQNSNTTFVDVILPLPLHQKFTYSIPAEMEGEIKPGCRVVVQFGARKYYTGLVMSLHKNKPQNFKTKPVTTLLDEYPVVNALQFKLWEWVASYYMCSPGEVMKAALPSGLKLESQSRIVINEDFTEVEKLGDDEELIYNVLLDKKYISLQEIANSLEKKSAAAIVKKLLAHGAVHVEEKMGKGTSKKTEKIISLDDAYTHPEKFNALADKLTRAPKQLTLLLSYAEAAKYLQKGAGELPAAQLLKKSGTSLAILRAMVEKGIFNQYEKEVNRIGAGKSTLMDPHSLNDAQAKALNEIHSHFKNDKTVLLHGITSSGKTEIYIHLIQENLRQGKQVLYLLPEIALTTQIITRLQNTFGEKAGVYHSRFNDAERVETWNRVMNTHKDDQFKLILGVRSSIFLPFSNLGLIIIDEEHENTFKQFDPAPRYHARDTALMLARMHGARVLLGTATPAVETYYNALSGKFGLVNLTSRHKEIALPEIKVVDVVRARKKKQMHAHFTPELINAIKNTLDEKKQVILFQNRRGFAPYIECADCGWVPQCQHCDVSLTYHKNSNYLVCHYCGFSLHIPVKCNDCSNAKLETRGFGTEKVEDDLHIFFPEAKIARLDLDSTRARQAYEKLFNAFESGETDILVGTQMVSKGLDFANVSLVGILNADNMLNYPDFRAYERSFQLMAQVSGRAGRSGSRGQVIIQASRPDNYIIRDVVDNNYQHMYEQQISEREEFQYPPFYRMIRLTLKHKKEHVLNRAAGQLEALLKKQLGNRVAGPQPPLIPRVQNLYIQQFLIRVEREKSFTTARQLILKSIKGLHQNMYYRSVIVQPDVDPV